MSRKELLNPARTHDQLHVKRFHENRSSADVMKHDCSRVDEGDIKIIFMTQRTSIPQCRSGEKCFLQAWSGSQR